MTCRFQFSQRFQAAGTLPLTTSIPEPELLAQEIGQLAPVKELVDILQPGHILAHSRLRQRPLDLVLCVHAASMCGTRVIVQLYLWGKGRVSYSENPFAWDFSGGLRYAYRDGSGWHTEIVDSTWYVGRHSSLALDESGNPHISHTQYAEGDFCMEWPFSVRYALRDASGWHTEIVDGGQAVGAHSSVAIDGAGHPHISYNNLGDLNYAHRDESCWHTETVDMESSGLDATCIVVDSSGRAHIAYIDNGGSGLGLKYARMTGVPVAQDPARPLRIELVEIWPNPARGVVYARVAMPEGRQPVSLMVVDLLGRRLATLPLPGSARSGNAVVTLRLPESVPSGQYFLCLDDDGQRRFAPVTMVR